MHKNETGLLSHNIHKTNSKWTKDLNVKFLEENMGGGGSKLFDVDHGNDFFLFDTESKDLQKDKTKQKNAPK